MYNANKGCIAVVIAIDEHRVAVAYCAQAWLRRCIVQRPVVDLTQLHRQHNCISITTLATACCEGLPVGTML